MFEDIFKDVGHVRENVRKLLRSELNSCVDSVAKLNVKCTRTAYGAYTCTFYVPGAKFEFVHISNPRYMNSIITVQYTVRLQERNNGPIYYETYSNQKIINEVHQLLENFSKL